MSIYMTKQEAAADKAVVFDDMFLTVDMPTTAGSKMLEGYKSLFEAEVLTRLKAAGYAVAGKTKVGEFGADLLGETCYFGAEYENETASLGYTYRYYIDTLYKNDNIKTIAVDGIAPTDDNIRSGAYPFTTNYYGVIREGDEEEIVGFHQAVQPDGLAHGDRKSVV